MYQQQTAPQKCYPDFGWHVNLCYYKILLLRILSNSKEENRKKRKTSRLSEYAMQIYGTLFYDFVPFREIVENTILKTQTFFKKTPRILTKASSLAGRAEISWQEEDSRDLAFQTCKLPEGNEQIYKTCNRQYSQRLYNINITYIRGCVRKSNSVHYMCFVHYVTEVKRWQVLVIFNDIRQAIVTYVNIMWAKKLNND
ncbi:Hypothetical_protein [Hexamita inflata]|uniref:Hypothetical_protein n=1 Tax=Hexamita inflata TaxID=28002 RepID=A0AA86QWR4_9EUKA|nr:Hypothetical protein HINF_LOCUS49852 [Hexamita inflata]